MNVIKQKLDALGYSADDSDNPTLGLELAARLEMMRGAPLPPEYRMFLQFYPCSGHFSEGNVVAREVVRPFKTESGLVTVDEFLAHDPGRGLEEKNRYDHQFLNMVWIGADVFGNRIYLDLNPESYGRVYWYDFESPNELGNLILVGNSFIHFVENLEVEKSD